MNTFITAMLLSNLTGFHCVDQAGQITTIILNKPQTGLAQIFSAKGGGGPSTVQIKTHVTKVGPGGCFNDVEAQIQFFHPYYDFNLQTSHLIGRPHTRCTGFNEVTVKQAFLAGEMQTPKALACKAF